MRPLLDVNFVIALLDPDHAFHERAHAWWAAQAKFGWASCPIVENGAVRIMSTPATPKRRGSRRAILLSRLQTFAAHPGPLQFCSNVEELTVNSTAPVQADAQGRYPGPIPGKAAEKRRQRTGN